MFSCCGKVSSRFIKFAKHVQVLNEMKLAYSTYVYNLIHH
jgi:hypothetical protein